MPNGGAGDLDLGTTAVKLNAPRSLAVSERTSFVDSLVMVTVAAGTAFPDWSITVPPIVPVVVI
jgi:hypothetical protein